MTICLKAFWLPTLSLISEENGRLVKNDFGGRLTMKAKNSHDPTLSKSFDLF